MNNSSIVEKENAIKEEEFVQFCNILLEIDDLVEKWLNSMGENERNKYFSYLNKFSKGESN